MIFWITAFAGVSAVVFATLMLAQRSLFSAAVCFLAVVLQSAVLLYASGARLLALLLVLIYAGAVAVLIVVAVQTAGGPGQIPQGSRWNRLGLPWPLAAAGLLLPVIDGALLLLRAGAARGPAAAAAARAGDLSLGPALFGPYAAAAEAAALLLLFAALAVIDSPEEQR
jgi:NADH:ubiquinone oxidoreductase subunit 6 (subunit J)